MKTPIRNIHQARAELQSVQESVVRLQEFLTRLSSVFEPTPIEHQADHPAAARPGAGSSWRALNSRTAISDRVMEILREKKAPMRPKDIVAEYCAKYHAVGAPGETYMSVLNATLYLTRRGRVTKLPDQSYTAVVQPVFVQPDLPENPEVKESTRGSEVKDSDDPIG